jgi:hypothetical protein
MTLPFVMRRPSQPLADVDDDDSGVDPLAIWTVASESRPPAVQDDDDDVDDSDRPMP